MSQTETRLREAAEAARTEMERIAQTAVDHNRDLSPNEEKRFTGLEEQLKGLQARAEAIREADQRAAEIEAAFTRIGGDKTPEERTAAGTWLPSLQEYRKLMADESRAIGTTGAFIPVGAAQQYMDLLRKRTAVLAAGPVLIPVEADGSLKVPTVTSSVTIGGIAENTAITPSDPTLSFATLDPIKVAAMTLVAREAVEDSQPNLREVIANSLVRDWAVELDRQLIIGSGAANNVRGIRNVASITAGPSQGANGAALGYAALADTLYAYELANADPDRAAWFLHPRTWNSIRKLADNTTRPLINFDMIQQVSGRCCSVSLCSCRPTCPLLRRRAPAWTAASSCSVT